MLLIVPSCLNTTVQNDVQRPTLLSRSSVALYMSCNNLYIQDEFVTRLEASGPVCTLHKCDGET